MVSVIIEIVFRRVIWLFWDFKDVVLFGFFDVIICEVFEDKFGEIVIVNFVLIVKVFGIEDIIGKVDDLRIEEDDI